MDLTASLTLSVPEYEKVGKSVESKLNNILSRHPDLVMETFTRGKKHLRQIRFIIPAYKFMGYLPLSLCLAFLI